MSATTADHAHWRPRANPWAIAVVVTMAAFMEIIDTTIVNVSLPHIAGSMSASYDDATWTLTSYLVANGIVLPISGWFGRLIGRKRYFMICIAAFTASSFLCGVATSLPQIIIFRLMQGFFGGGLQPNQQSIILDTFEPSQRGRAFSVVAIATIFAPVIGPTLGGWITDNYTWRWVFLINVPVGIIAFLAVGALVEDPPWVKAESANRKGIDYIGVALIALGIGCLQIMLDRGEDNDWFGDPTIRAFGILAAIGLIGAAVWLSIAKNPVVNIRVLRDRNFALGSVMIFMIGAILYSSAVLIPQLAQEQLGYTAMLAGLILSPGAVLIIVLIPIITRLLPHIPTKYFIGFGFFSLGCALAYAHSLTPDVDYNTLALMRAAQTFGLAFLFVPNSTIAYSTLPRSANADASSLYVMFRNISGSIGISLSTALETERTQIRRSYLAPHLTPLEQPYVTLKAQIANTLMAHGTAASAAPSVADGLINMTLQKQAAVLAYTDVFAITSIAAFCVVPITLLFSSSRATGRPRAEH